MAGIYVHIPYCRKACHYCNFHFSTSLNNVDPMIDAICSEIEMRDDFLEKGKVSTIYFGGGTPSILTAEQLQRILTQISAHHSISPDAEITLEANPEDLSLERAAELRDMGVNRLSIGIQSFLPADLEMMNRAHTIAQSHEAIQNAKSAGIDNLSIDLMFGLVSSDLEAWRANLEQAIEHKPSHISCYNLTIEEQTAYAHWIKKNKIQLPAETVQYDQFLLADEMLSGAGYDHYEISNYALPRQKSNHNTSYWQRKAYLGIGPAAHSYQSHRRYWNVADNQKYIKALTAKELPISSESLSEVDRYNEMLMLSLRTSDGIGSTAISQYSPEIQEHYYHIMDSLVSKGRVIQDDQRWHLPVSMWYQSDDIGAELFYTED